MNFFGISAPSIRRRAPRPTVASRLGLLGAFLALSTSAALHAQSVPAYAGRPFVRIAQANVSDPQAGFISGFGRAQLVGDSVVFVSLAGPNASGVFRGRGGPLTKVAAPGTAVPDGTLLFFHDGFARDTGVDGLVALAAGSSRADALYRTDGTDFTTLFASGGILPNSGGKAANVLGEPSLVQGAVAVIAAHQPAGGGEDFRGVYRVQAGALEAVADVATELPGGFGVPDGFSSQVGFDGQMLAFWATRGPFTENEGMFVQAGNGTLTKIAQNGDGFPGGGTIEGFISPPFVSAGVVYFFAYDSASKTRLLKYQAGGLTVLAQDGDPAPDGGALQNLGQFGLAVEGGRVFFPALTAKGAGCYVLEGGLLQAVVPAGVTLGGILPTAIVLQDVAGDTVVLDIANASSRRLVANLASPAVPVIVAEPSGQTVAAGARVELKVTALGDAPLKYTWNGPAGVITNATSDTLVLEAAGAAHVGYYRVTVSNPAGSAFSANVLLNVEIKPELAAVPVDKAVEVGDQLTLQVTAFGGQPLTFFWSKDGAPATNETPTPGFFVRTAAALTDAGRYLVVVSNAFGQVTSAEAVVTVTPSAPNPVFGGGRFVAVVDGNTPVPETAAPFSTSTMGEYSARFLGTGIVFVGGPSDQPQGGVYRWQEGALTRLLAAGITLPNGLGAAEAFGLVNAPAGEALAVSGSVTVNGFRQPVGLYRYAAPSLLAVADTTREVPESGGALFPTFFSDAVQASGRTLFGATVGGKPALYLGDESGLKRVFSAQQDLPVVGSNTTQFQGLSYDGQTFTVTAATASQQQLVALRVNAEGAVTKLLATGEPLPGTADTVRSIGSSDTEAGASYLLVFNQTFATHVVEWRDGTLTRLAGPGMTVGALGAIQSLETSFPKVSAGRSFVAARVTTPQGVARGIVAAGAGGIEPVLFAPKLDARRVAASYVVDADGDRVLVLVDFVGGGRALYANVGAVDAEPLRLELTRPDAATLRFTVPVGAVLEAAGTPGGTWETVTGNGEVEVPVNPGARFFRLRQP